MLYRFKKPGNLITSKIQRFFSYFWILSISFFVFAVFAQSIGTNVFSENFSGFSKSTVNYLLPQGWGFFTKNPADTKYKLFAIEGNSAVLVNEKNSDFVNYFGLSRRSRRFGYEFGKIYTAIKPQFWSKPPDKKLSVLFFKNPLIIKMNEEFRLIKGGKFLVIKYEDVPWAWANDVHQPKIISYVSILIKS